MQVYQLKVSLFGYHEQPINKLHRIIEISENSTFEDLHEAIFEAFDRFDPHLYTFFMTKKNTTSMRDIMDAPAITNPYSVDEDMMFHSKPDNAVTTTIKDAKLKEKDVFHYWFDFGDDWWHRIRVEKITTSNRRKKAFAKVTKKVGESPAQYDYDEDDFDEGFAIDFNSLDLENIDINQIDLQMLGIEQTKLADIGIDEDDLIYIMQTIQGDNPNSIAQIVDKYGVDKIIAIFEVTGIPKSETKPIENMLNNIPILNFLEALEDPEVNLQQERDLLEILIQKLQVRLSNLENKIADDAEQVSTKKKGE